ncbi:MAG: polysaccharide deacetylase family protein [Gammaproteobacteria bacterium]|nr:polysaccharide deacetylase family protein [Gammaproteobacteria bacterium]
MPLDPSYFEYPHRSYGMDHDYYDWSMLADREPVEWPGGNKLALWVNVGLQFFPLNQQGKPFPPPGGMTTAYPDLRHYTLRDYGNRVGIYRFLKAFDKYGIKASFAINSRLAERYPYLVNKIVERGDEILCHGWDMDTPHYGGMVRDEEAGIIAKSLEVLRAATGKPVTGWISPGKSQSFNTPELLAEHGIEYMCDWINDDMPYQFRTKAGEITAMPLSTELEDRFILLNNLHSESEYADQIMDAFDYLYAEADQQGGRMLALNIHPWMLGQPHRIGKLEQVLEYITEHDGVWSASATDIRSAWLVVQ